MLKSQLGWLNLPQSPTLPPPATATLADTQIAHFKILLFCLKGALSFTT